MEYIYDESTSDLVVLESDGTEVLRRRALRDIDGEYWVDAPPEDQPMIRRMMEDDQLFDRFGGAHGQMAIFDGKNPKLQHVKHYKADPKRIQELIDEEKDVPKKKVNRPVDPLNREILLHQTRLNSGELDEKQTENVKKRIGELKLILESPKDYKRYQSEFQYYMDMSRTVGQNLEKTIQVGDSTSVGEYWPVFRSMLTECQKIYDTYQREYGMNPSQYEWVFSNEFGEWKDPKRKMAPDKYTDAYVRPSNRFRSGKQFLTADDRVSSDGLRDHKLALGAARRFMEYADLMEKSIESIPVAKDKLTTTAEIFREKALDNLWTTIPIIDNLRARVMERLGFNGLCEFSAGLLTLRDRYINLAPGDSRKEILGSIKSLYRRYDIRKSPKSDVEQRLDALRATKKKPDETVMEIRHLL